MSTFTGDAVAQPFLVDDSAIVSPIEDVSIFPINILPTIEENDSERSTLNDDLISFSDVAASVSEEMDVTELNEIPQDILNDIFSALDSIEVDANLQNLPE